MTERTGSDSGMDALWLLQRVDESNTPIADVERQGESTGLFPDDYFLSDSPKFAANEQKVQL